MRLTIERMRTLVLGSALLLLTTLAVFLVRAHWKSRFNIREIPKHLGADIKQEANGITYTQSSQGHTLFKIHASREVQLEKSGRVILHDVRIEIYGPDGKSLDHISGGEFEYDQKTGIATAAGPVEILLARPVGRAAAPVGDSLQDKAISSALKQMAHAAGPGQIDVKTSGLTFDQKKGIASTQQALQFTSAQGSGSAVGATFDSQAGTLLLSHDFELNMRRSGEAVKLRAASAALDRGQLLCRLHGATAEFRDGSATAGDAQILFRPDGSAARLDARNGFALNTAGGSKVAAPVGWMVFNQKSQPVHGQMLDGVKMESADKGRITRGSASTADLGFNAKGELRRARLERGVQIHSEQPGAAGTEIVRDWKSPAVDLGFSTARGGRTGLEKLHGEGGVVLASHVRRGAALESPSRMAADSVQAEFGARNELTRLIGTGHASLQQTSSNGAVQTIAGDRVDAQFTGTSAASGSASGQIRNAVVDGHVVLTDRPVSKAGQAEPPLTAKAGRALYDGKGQWLHLAGAPRVDDGGLNVTADRIDVSQAGGSAFAHGHVKGTWEAQGAGQGRPRIELGGSGPAHMVADEGQMNRTGNEATFRGNARIWQQANSISAPVIVLNQDRQTLVAHSSGRQRVMLTMMTAPGKGQPELVRVWAGDLHYSEAERKAVLLGSVVAQTATASISSERGELLLSPMGKQTGQRDAAGEVERITLSGGVQIASQGRRGRGEQLDYTGATGNYVLTGTAAEPPTLTDPGRGSVRGQALIFNGRDDSVRIEGRGRKTTTETLAPR